MHGFFLQMMGFSPSNCVSAHSMLSLLEAPLPLRNTTTKEGRPMKTLLYTPLVVLILACPALADHELRGLRHEYDAHRIELENEYKARREAARFNYHRERDLLRAERSRVLRIDCHETRAHRLRAVNRQFGEAARAFGAKNRHLARWYHRELELLRDSYEQAKRDIRFGRAEAYPVTTYRAHPDDCSCSVCQPPLAVPPAHVRVIPDHHGHRHHGHRRKIDWAGLVLNLLLN